MLERSLEKQVDEWKKTNTRREIYTKRTFIALSYFKAQE
jgi:hypothetical protein